MLFETNTVVWASAGTGKTRKLVQVYLELLERGIDPLRIVAVTFTERAAAEMRDRIRTTLDAKPGQWSKTISILAAAPISTIHGFCGAMLREHGIELGIDPSFSILDEQRSLDVAREAARESTRQEIRNGNEEVENLFRDFGLNGLVETLVSIGYWLNSLGHDAAWLETRVQDQRSVAVDLEREIGDEIRKHGGAFDAIGELSDALEAKKAKHPLRKRDDPQALLPQIGQIAGVETSARLSRLAGLFIERFRSKKRAANAMDFDDLLLGVRDLLRQHDSIRRHYQNHFQALLVDEFQDTDEVQAEIISLLAEDPENPGRLARRKLMIVGDPKQSIYRFRRARVTVFFRMLQRILNEGGNLEHLQDNYRSAAPIAEFSNRLSQTMMDGLGKIGHVDDSQVDLSYRVRFSDRDLLKPKSDAPFLGITYVAAESRAKAAEGREMEAEAIARLLKQWKSSGRIQSWKEVAFLMRAMTNVEIYLTALEAHRIPVYVVQGTSFYQKSEVSDLIAFLELVLHPHDELLRATVLTSSLFGITFNELIRMGIENWELNFDQMSSDLTNSQFPIPNSHPSGFSPRSILEYWLERRDTATAAEILQDVIRKTNFDVVVMAQKDGAQRVANIGKLIEITRQLAHQGTTALDDIVRYLRDRANDPTVREPEAQIVSQDDDVVRVLTVHQAKGLEFDIVIIPDLAARAGRGTGDRTFFSDRWGLLAGAAYGLHRKPLPHSLILEAKQLEEDQQYEEEKRLLYVAVTRARKMLVLGEGFSKQTGPWLQWMEQPFEAIQPGAIEKARDGMPQTVKFKGFSAKVLPASQLNVPEQLSFRADAILVGEPDIPRVGKPGLPAALEMTPSDLTTLNGCFRYFHWTRILGLSEPGREPTGNSAQMRLGSIAHKILETAIAPAHAALTAVGVVDLESVFQSAQWRDLSSASPEREMPFIMHLDVDGKDCWVRGRMDAIVPGDVPRVIDYKYALWHEGAENDYEVQMAAYSLALMKALAADRAAAELWYLKSPMKIIRREYTLREAEERLRDLLSRYVKAIETDRWPHADPVYCERIECGFRRQCWGATT
jgi:ATP-dependent helicase/nuclease subunit A